MGKGLKGWFGNLLRGVVKAVAGAIVGAIHPALALASASFINNQVNNWLSGPFWQSPNSSSGGFGIMQKGNFQLATDDDDVVEQKNKEIHDWIKAKITKSWINSFFKNISASNHLSVSFKNDINKILLKLEALRLYYAGNNQLKKMQKSGLVLNIEDEIENAVITSKAQFFGFLQDIIRKSYEKALKDAGRVFNTKTLNGFKANLYLISNKPEPFTFNFSAQSDIPLYVFDESENVTVNYADGSSVSTGDSFTQTDAPAPSNNPKLPTDKNSDPTKFFAPTDAGMENKTQTAFAWIGGVIAGTWLLKKVFKNK